MRAVVGCALLSLWLGAGARADGLPGPRHEASCEEQCQLEQARDDAACDEGVLMEGDRALCHQAVQARLEVCLKVCED